MTWRIRPLAPDEWVLMKTMRIAALRDSPDAFRTTAEDAVKRTNTFWIDMCRGLADPHNDTLISTTDTDAGGTLYVRASPDGIGYLGAMWVDPARRNLGLGRMLIEAAIAWHRDAHMDCIELSVTRGNDAAEHLYARHGFRPTGATEPLREGSELRSITLRLDL